MVEYQSNYDILNNQFPKCNFEQNQLTRILLNAKTDNHPKSKNISSKRKSTPKYFGRSQFSQNFRTTGSFH